MSRYDQLLSAIDLFKPQSIVEIGAWSGKNAVRMIKQAQKYRKNIIYIGYDLFEDATLDTDSGELNVKPHHSVDDVEAVIARECPEAEIHLIKGNTRDTLTNIAADFVYIDGGHSVETIASDYKRCSGSKIIVFDDYYIKDKEGKCPDIEKYGCNKVVGGLKNAIILPVGGKVRETGGLTMMAMVIGGSDE